MKTKIPFFKHHLGGPELREIKKVLHGSILTTGSTVEEFENRFARWLARRYAVGVTSCTGALHIALEGLGVGPGDEVITTPMTFIATATAILHTGAKPVFVDVEPDTGNLNAAKVASAVNRRTKAIVPVHLYGQMCDMRALHRIAGKHRLAIVEDAAHCVEGERDGARPGQLSDAACFSFYATKNLSCGEGGAVVTDQPKLRERLRLLRLHGMNKMAADREKEGYSHWDMILLGWKYNMDNFHAAMLLPQLERLREAHRRREYLAERYMNLLQNIPGLRFPAVRSATRHARHLFVVRVDPDRRDWVIQELQARGIASMVNYRAIHLLSYFKKTFGYRPGDYPDAERFGSEVISLPFYPMMPAAHPKAVASAFKSILGKSVRSDSSRSS